MSLYKKDGLIIDTKKIVTICKTYDIHRYWGLFGCTKKLEYFLEVNGIRLLSGTSDEIDVIISEINKLM